MAGSKTLRSPVRAIMCYLILWWAALPYVFRLLRLALSMARVLRKYRKTCKRSFRSQLSGARIRRKQKRAIGSLFIAFRRGAFALAVWPVASFLQAAKRLGAMVRWGTRLCGLFRLLPVPSALDDESLREWLNHVYREAKAVAARRPKSAARLTAHLAKGLQATILKHEFNRLFGIRLTPQQLQYLDWYPRVSLAVRDFLESCGCPTHTPSFGSLGRHLTPFVLKAAERGHTLSWRQKTLLHLSRVRQYFGVLGAFSSSATILLCRAYWLHQDIREKMVRKRIVTFAHYGFQTQLASSTITIQRGSQATVFSVLAAEMHIRALEVLAKTSVELCKIESNVASKYPGPDHQKAFQKALDSLDDVVTRLFSGRSDMNANDGAIVPRNDEPGSELVKPPEEVTFAGIAKFVKGDNMNWLDKCALARVQTKALVAQRKQQFAAALKTSEIAIEAQVTMAARTITLYRDKFETEIRGAYVEMTAALGQRVESAQIESMADFGEQLTRFKRQLDGRDIDPEFKKRILENVVTAFNRMYDKLEGMTEEIIVSAEAKK